MSSNFKLAKRDYSFVDYINYKVTILRVLVVHFFIFPIAFLLRTERDISRDISRDVNTMLIHSSRKSHISRGDSDLDVSLYSLHKR